MDTPNDSLEGTEDVDPALDPGLDQFSRRSLLTRLSAGAVAAAVVTPAGAQEAFKTGKALQNDAIEKKNITFRSNAVKDKPADVKGFLALPNTETPRGSVMVVHEIFGLNDHIRDVACRLALAGYAALAVDFFTREGEPPKLEGNNFQPVMAFVSKISDAQILGDADAGAAYLRGLKHSNKKVGIVGFCWGGRVSMLAATHPAVDAAVAYYGRITSPKSETQPAHPVDLVEKFRAPLLGHFGEKDGGIPAEGVRQFGEKLKEAGKTVEIHVYEGAGHAFNNDTRESYNQDAAVTSWKRTLAWYAKYLKG